MAKGLIVVSFASNVVTTEIDFDAIIEFIKDLIPLIVQIIDLFS